MKQIFKLLLFAPLLVGCTTEQPYKGPKLQLQYVEEGTLVTSSVQEMKEVAFDNKIDSVFYIGDDDCSACSNLKSNITNWCSNNHANVYYIEYTSLNTDDLNLLESITKDSDYDWNAEKASLPATYFMMQGYIIFKGASDNTMKYLKRYVEVVDTTSSTNQ